MIASPRNGLDHGGADWAGLRVLVTGLGVSGFAAADALLERGADVLVVDAGDSPAMTERARILEILGARLLLGPDGARAGGEAVAETISGLDLVVTSPGWRPDTPLLVAAAAAGVPVWGEVELAWRMRARENPAPWLVVTGTNGKTTVVTMLATILRAAGLRATAAGNVGTPILEAVLHPDPYDVIAVELSSFQLHWQDSVSPLASACLNVAPDHLDWHGGIDAYAAAKGKVYENTQVACVFNEQDPTTMRLVQDATVVDGCRAVSFSLGVPGLSTIGVVEDVLADRAFVQERATSAAGLGTLADLERDGVPAAPHVVANALAAAALARAAGVPPVAVRDGLRAYEAEPHRIATVTRHADVLWIDDSKATNTHAAASSLNAYPSIVWIAGGLLKGAEVDALVAQAAPRLRGVVLLGADRERIAQALARHAPDVPVIDVPDTDTGAMTAVVRAAATLARPGDAVLLAPAAASMDMFTDYGARGDAFAAAVHRHVGGIDGAGGADGNGA